MDDHCGSVVSLEVTAWIGRQGRPSTPRARRTREPPAKPVLGTRPNPARQHGPARLFLGCSNAPSSTPRAARQDLACVVLASACLQADGGASSERGVECRRIVATCTRVIPQSVDRGRTTDLPPQHRGVAVGTVVVAREDVAGGLEVAPGVSVGTWALAHVSRVSVCSSESGARCCYDDDRPRAPTVARRLRTSSSF